MLMPSFRRFPDEAVIIGRILAGYTDLEVGMMNCVQMATGDFDTTMKVMFRTRGESQRISLADAMGRHIYGDLRLGLEFETALASVKRCLSIRNQYAHCVWWDDNTGQLALADMEDIAVSPDYQTDLRTLPTRHVDVPLLRQQQTYFEYADAWLAFVNYEGRHRAGKLTTQPLPRPAQLGQPPLHL